MSWRPQDQQQQQQQQQQQRPLPRILAETETEGRSSMEAPSSIVRRMGPPSQSLPSLNFRQLAPLRSPNLPSTNHSGSYFTQQRLRSTSESTANDALRSLRQLATPSSAAAGAPAPPHPQELLPISVRKSETLPPLAAFGHPPSPPRATYRARQSSAASSTSSSQSVHYHPYYQQQTSAYASSNPQPSIIHRSPPSSSSSSSSHFNALSRPFGSTRPSSSPSVHDPRFYSPGPSSFDVAVNVREGSMMSDRDDSTTRKLAKSHVPSACLNCKRAHLACDVSRPCRRCINLGKTDTCIDVQHKKRGRPRLRDREAAAAAAAAAVAGGVSSNEHRVSNGLPGQRMRHSISSSSSTSTMRQSPRSESAFFSPPLEPSGMIQSPVGSSRGAMTLSSKASTVSSRGRSISAGSGSTWAIPHGHSSMDIDSSNDVPPTVSLILSTGLQCARCSVESHSLLGYSPSDLVERSLFELVHPTETQRLEQLWLSLINPVGVKPQAVPADAETVMSLSPAVLMAPAPGTVFLQESMRLRQRSGIYDFYSIRLHLGGGFGADLFQPATLDRAYIVASLLKLGNDTTHPDPSILQEAQWYSGSSSRYFYTPQAPKKGGRSEGQAGSPAMRHPPSTGPRYTTHSDSEYHPSPWKAPPTPYDWQRLDRNNNASPAPVSSTPTYDRRPSIGDAHRHSSSKPYQRTMEESAMPIRSMRQESERAHINRRVSPTPASHRRSSYYSHPSLTYSGRSEPSGGIVC